MHGPNTWIAILYLGMGSDTWIDKIIISSNNVLQKKTLWE